MNKKFVLFFFLLQKIFLTPYGLTEEKTYDLYKTSEEQRKLDQERRDKEWKEKQEEMKEKKEYLENTKTIKNEGNGVYRKIYEDGSEYLCIRQSLGDDLCKKL